MEEIVTAIVSEAWRFPLKGARGERRQRLIITENRLVRGDRIYGIPLPVLPNGKRVEAPYDTWKKKVFYHVGMNTATMAAITPHYVPATNDEDIPVLDPLFLEELGRRLGYPKAVMLQDTRGEYSVADMNQSLFSLVNPASVEAISHLVGHHIDCHRFRANVYVGGMKALEEYKLVGKTVRIGTVEATVKQVTTRCKAINASISLGVYDETLGGYLEKLAIENGYQAPDGKRNIMGVYLEPTSAGEFGEGDEIHVIN